MGIRFDGLATGLNTTAVVDALVQLERQPLRQLQQRRSAAEQTKSLFRELNTLVKAFDDSLRAIDNRNFDLSDAAVEEEFFSYSASSGDESLVTVTTNAGNAAPGSIDVKVNALARAGRQVSQGFEDANATIADEGDTLEIAHGGADPISITVGAGGASLSELVDLINTDVNNGGRVQAAIVSDGTDEHLVITGAKTGVDNDLVITTTISGPAGGADPFLDSALTQAASDASIEVFGLTVTRAENIITGAIPGVTLTLRGEQDPTDEPLKIEIERDDEAMGAKLQAVADAYNEIAAFADQHGGRDGALAGDSSLASIETNLRGALFDPSAAGGTFTRVSEIGLRFDQKGRLNFEADILKQALDQDPQAVRTMLSGDGTNPGVATAAAAGILGLLQSVPNPNYDPNDPNSQETFDSLFQTRIKSMDSRVRNFDSRIEALEIRIEKREDSLRLQFSRLESLIQDLQSQSGFLNGFGAF